MEVRPGLVEMARHGDRRAFEVLAGRIVDRMHSIASLILHDPTLADDAVQEALVRVWRDLPRLRDVDRFEGWLHSVLAHTCLDVLRRERREIHLAPLPDVLVDRQRLESEVADRDTVDRALEQLTPQHRAVLVMHHYAGFTLREVAGILKLPVGTAKSRLHYAERAMHAAVDAESRLVPARGELA